MPDNNNQDLNKLDHLYGAQLSTVFDPDTDQLIRINLEKIRQKRRNFNLPVIGITGSNGKTITKSMLSQIISPLGPVLETPYNCQTSYTVTSTVRKLHKHHKHALIEFGISAQDKIERAIRVAMPNIGLVTNVGDAHLAYLKNRINIASAKSELVKNLPTDGYAILNKDDELASEMAKISPTQNIVRFGLSRQADFFASNIENLGPKGTKFTVNHTFDVKMNIYSISDIYNALGAISAARVLGVDFDDIFKRLAKFTLPVGRGRLIPIDGKYIIDDLYDTSVNSARKAAQTLLGFREYSDKLGLILGDLDEFEGNRDDAFRALGHYLSVFSFDYFIFIGENAHFFAEGVKIIPHGKEIYTFPTIHEARETIINSFVPNSTFLLKGNIGYDADVFMDQIIRQVA